MRFARARAIAGGALLVGAPGLVHAAPAGGSVPGATEVAAGGERVTEEPGEAKTQPAGERATEEPSERATEARAERAARERTTEARAEREARERTSEEAEERAVEEAAAERPVRERPRTWQIYQRPLPGAEHSWGPPNGQMPAVAEVVEEPPDPHRPPPTGTPRIAIGAVVGALGLGVLGLGIAARTTDVLGADHRAGVPLIGAGLVTAAIGWGLFAHGILRRGAYLRWKNGQATVAAGPFGGALVVRF